MNSRGNDKAGRRNGRGRGRVRSLALCCLLLTPLFSVQAGSAQTAATPRFGPSVHWIPDSSDARTAAVEVRGLSPASLKRWAQTSRTAAQWQKSFSVYAIPSTPSGLSESTVPTDLPPMLGNYRTLDNALRFEPRYSLQPGITYRAVYVPGPAERKGGGIDRPITAEYRLPARESISTTVVTHVYPSAETLPENLLKFYLHFSAPMRRGNIYDYIHLRDEQGKEIELPFLEIGEELWNPALTRVTLLIDPGRIKRGVLPLEEIGPSLEQGKRYSLTIDREWRDGNGDLLKEGFEKVFTVGPPDRDPPDPATWKIEAPRPDTPEPLTIVFPDPMDQALAERLVAVTDLAGTPVEGKTMLTDQERRWTFVPDRPWSSGRYQLVIQTIIEDLAGNNIGKPFEVDLFNQIQRRLESPTVKLPFEIR
ncbi:MAG TPA: Ig-like domain-containing protein [Blastocatellia bacterium]|nr:Ig-like domain-containing protein [Blastocatellia bacterium]